MRTLLAALLFPACLLVVITAVAQPAADVAGTSTEDIVALQRRLADAKCYSGAIDGHVSMATTQGIDACPDQRPRLLIETGMHGAAIMDIATNASCTFAATASNDKTVRLWSLPDGRLLYTERLPIGEGNEGRLDAIAISPDGKLIAVGGIDAFIKTGASPGIGVYIFDATSGREVRRIGAFADAVRHLAFSPDGSKLAIGLGSNEGLRVMDVASGQVIMADRQYRDRVYSVLFGPHGELFAASADGMLRRYGADLRSRKEARTRGGTQAYSLALDPSGTLLAVGYLEEDARKTRGADIFAADRLKYRTSVSTSGIAYGDFRSVAWLGRDRLIGAGTAGPGSAVKVLRMWDADGRPVAADRQIAKDTVTSITSCGAGAVFASYEPTFGMIEPDGVPTTLRTAPKPDLRGKVLDGLAVSQDATRVRFGLEFATGEPVLFDLNAGRVEASEQAPYDLTFFNYQGVDPTHVINSPQPVLFGQRIILDHDEVLRSVAIRSSGDLALATSYGLSGMSFSPAGGRQIWKKVGYGDAWGVQFAKNDQLLIAAYSDGTIRWHRWSDGQELLALFVDKVNKRWVAWTPTGYYMASAGGEDLIGWHVNRGWDQTADFFPASRFRARFSRPDIVRLVLTTLDEDAAVRQANEAARRKEDTKPLIAQLPPVIRIVAPTSGSHATTSEVTIDYAWRSPSGQPVDQIAVLVNNRTIKTKGLPLRPSGQDTERDGSVTVPLGDRNNEIGLIARSGDMSSQVASVKIEWDGAPATTSQDRKLYAVVVGISNYADADISLGFAAKDAGDFAKALDDQKGGYYGDVQTHLITDRAATRESIVEGLEWLETNVTRKDDVGVLFLAGHGVTDDKQAYWFLPADATDDNFRFKGVSQDEMQRSLQTLPGKVLWFLDTCHAGGAANRSVDINVLVNAVTAPENGSIVTFASSTGSELSEERPDWHNGAFTKAIVEGIEEGRAARAQDGNVMAFSLETFLEARVQELTADKQHPVLGWPPGETNFAIARKSEHPQK